MKTIKSIYLIVFLLVTGAVFAKEETGCFGSLYLERIGVSD